MSLNCLRWPTATRREIQGCEQERREKKKDLATERRVFFVVRKFKRL